MKYGQLGRQDVVEAVGCEFGQVHLLQYLMECGLALIKPNRECSQSAAVFSSNRALPMAAAPCPAAWSRTGVSFGRDSPGSCERLVRHQRHHNSA
jgi:hypothetical protein